MDSDSRESVKSSLGAYKTIFLFLNNYNFEISAETFKRELEALGQTLRDIPSITVTLQPSKHLQNLNNQIISNQKNASNSKFGNDSKPKPKIEQSQVIFVPENETWKENQTQTLNIKDFPLKRDKNEYEKLKSKFLELQNEHKKLIAVTSELTTALQLNVIGQTKNIHHVIDQCKLVFPTLFPSAAEQVSGKFSDTQEKINETSNIKKLLTNVIENDMLANESDTLEPYPQSQVNVVSNMTQNEAAVPGGSEPKDNSGHQKERNVVSPLDLEQLNTIQESGCPLTPKTVRKILDSVLNRIFHDSRQDTGGSASPVIGKDQIEEIVTTAITEVLESPQHDLPDENQLNKQQPESKIPKPKENQGKPSANSVNIVQLFELDYKRIKSDLMTCGNEKVLRILQALRWRITRSSTSDRNRVIGSYVQNDFLCLKSSKSVPEHFLDSMTQVYIQDSVCRLLNTVASLKEGRDYLLSDDTIFKKILMPKVKVLTDMPSSIVRNMIIATLQKLSIRKQPRTMMVNEGLLELLVDFLDEYHDKLPRYCLEYCSALVMNLCLVPDAKWRAGKIPKKIVRLIKKLLESNTTCVLPYVNGIMFSLFENDAVVWEAKNQNIEDCINDVQNKLDNDNVKSQLDFVVKFRLTGNEGLPVEDGDDENQEEVDLLEVELDEDDYYTNLPSGEELLEEYKVDSSKNITNKIKETSSSRSYCEETLQFYHKPSAEKGIFEKSKYKKLRTPQNVIKSVMTKDESSPSTNKHFKRVPSTTVCYFEPITRNQDTSQHNRYSCSCYDKMCKEIAEDDIIERRNANYGDSGEPNQKINFKSLSSKPARRSFSNVPFDPMERLLSPTRISSKNSYKGSKKCNVCFKKTCDCAFEPRPKICRTPPSNSR